MMFHYKARYMAAFTILEMLMVMVILTLSISLVSPVLLNQISGYKQKSELHKLGSLIESVRDQAFFSGKTIVIKIEKGEVIFDGKTTRFKDIVLADQTLVITNRYQIFPDQVKYKMATSNEIKVLKFND